MPFGAGMAFHSPSVNLRRWSSNMLSVRSNRSSVFFSSVGVEAQSSSCVSLLGFPFPLSGEEPREYVERRKHETTSVDARPCRGLHLPVFSRLGLRLRYRMGR